MPLLRAYKEILTGSVVTKFSGPPFSESPISNCTYGTRSVASTSRDRPMRLAMLRRVSTKRCSEIAIRGKRTIQVVANTTVPGNYSYYIHRRSASCKRRAIEVFHPAKR